MLKRIVVSFSSFLNDIDIRKKLMASYFILIFLPLALFSLVIYNKISSNLEQQIMFSASQSATQAISFLEDKLDRAITVTDSIIFNEDIQRILTRNMQSYRDDLDLQNTDYRKIINILSGFQQDKSLFKARLYVRSGLIYSEENMNLFNIDDIKNVPWYRKLINSKEKAEWCPPEDYSNPGNYQPVYKVISVVRKIRNVDDLLDFIGVVRVDIQEKEIRDIISNANLAKNGIIYITNSDGNLITTNNYEELKNYIPDGSELGSIGRSSSGWVQITVGNKKFMVNGIAINNTDWVLVSLIPFEEVISTGSQFKNYMIFLILTIIFIAYLFAYLISNSSIKRIGFLVKSMEKLEQGIFQTDMPVHGKDEIGRLMEKFNYMSKKMEQMVREQFEAGQKLKNAELKALQSQINPHFLYNTLDMINWSAAVNQVSDIVQTVQSLAKFYKLSLSKGRDIIPISDEIEHVKAYVEIQNQRFEDRIKFVLDIDEKVCEYSTLKIIVQPFVENAILHGIMEKQDKTGSIKITARIIDENIVFVIEDDGIGIAEEKINSILITEMSSQNKGYGIKNINDRIKLYFGEQYGLKYLSGCGSGTKVEITIPKIK